jgi:hypothetical protein
MDILPAVPQLFERLKAGYPMKGAVTVHPDIRTRRFFHDQPIPDDQRSTARNRPRECRAVRVQGNIDQHDDNEYAER